MDNIKTGINETELSNLSIEVLNSADTISEITDKIDSYMDSLPDYYQGESCKKLLESYDKLKRCFPTIKDNIASYSDDFMALIRKMHETDKKLTNIFQQFTDDTNNKKKNISFKEELK